MQIKELLEAEYSESHIASIVRCTPRTVNNWANRFQIEKTLFDRNRSGRPSIIPLAAKFRLVGFYCQHEPLPGCSRWTIRWAESYLNENPSILQIPISRSSIHRCLAFNALKPHKWKYFLHISDPYFFEKMEKIIWLYLNPPKNLYCLDECTGLQALEQIAPKLFTGNSNSRLLEFEYKRHGTVSIFSVLKVSDGKVFTDIIPDHTALTIIESLKKHITLHSGNEIIHYICDNYSSHSTEEFCHEIATLCKIKCSANLDTLSKRKQWLESEDKRIIFHYTPCHGSWLNMIEIWFGILQQKSLKGESFTSTTKLEEGILNFTDTWNEHFSHPFKWNYKGDGLYDKVVSRLTRWLQLESRELCYVFFEKQLKLMINLVANHWGKINKELWAVLHQTLNEKYLFTETIIRSVNFDTFKDLKGKKNDTEKQRKEKIVNKVEETKKNLTLLLSDFNSQLSIKLK